MMKPTPQNKDDDGDDESSKNGEKITDEKVEKPEKSSVVRESTKNVNETTAGSSKSSKWISVSAEAEDKGKTEEEEDEDEKEKMEIDSETKIVCENDNSKIETIEIIRETISSIFDGIVPSEGAPVKSEIAQIGTSLTDIINKITNFFVPNPSGSSKDKDSGRRLNKSKNCLNLYGDDGREKTEATGNRSKSVVITYPGRQRPRQPFMNQPTGGNRPPSAVPNPPSYYNAGVVSQQPGRQNSRSPTGQPQPPSQPQTSPERTTVQQEEPLSRSRPREETGYTPYGNFKPGQMMMMPNVAMGVSYWAPYPEGVPANIPPCLAHLVAADSIFIVQQMDVIELFMNVTQPNYFLIQNALGQCIYYAYETTDIFAAGCCQSKRGFQLHIMDMYHNEIIYMNKACGCNDCFCCYPTMEVYAPPLVPVGAITQKFRINKVEFSIIDAQENKIFKIYGPCCCMASRYCGEVDFVICALDEEETEVGFIRRQLGTFISSVYTATDYYGITFPIDLDVKVKAIFLGALFLIEYTYFDLGSSSIL